MVSVQSSLNTDHCSLDRQPHRVLRRRANGGDADQIVLAAGLDVRPPPVSALQPLVPLTVARAGEREAGPWPSTGTTGPLIGVGLCRAKTGPAGRGQRSPG